MRVVRSTGQTIAPSDDAKLYRKLFTDGLFDDATITSLGANQVNIPALYGIMQGREFINDAETFSVELPNSDSTGYILVRFDTTTDEVGEIVSELAPYTPVYQDINGTGTVCEMVLAEYTANATQVTGITMVYKRASATDLYFPGFNIPSASATYTISNANIHADEDTCNIEIVVAQADLETFSDAEPSYTQAEGSLTITFGTALASAVHICNYKVVNL